MYVFFMFNVTKIKYNLTKKNVYDIFNMRLCIKKIFDVKKRIIKIIFDYICFQLYTCNTYGSGASEVITEGYTIITWENEVKKELKSPQTIPEKWYD